MRCSFCDNVFKESRVTIWTFGLVGSPVEVKRWGLLTEAASGALDAAAVAEAAEPTPKKRHIEPQKDAAAAAAADLAPAKRNIHPLEAAAEQAKEVVFTPEEVPAAAETKSPTKKLDEVEVSSQSMLFTEPSAEFPLPPGSRGTKLVLQDGAPTGFKVHECINCTTSRLGEIIVDEH